MIDLYVQVVAYRQHDDALLGDLTTRWEPLSVAVLLGALGAWVIHEERGTLVAVSLAYGPLSPGFELQILADPPLGETEVVLSGGDPTSLGVVDAILGAWDPELIAEVRERVRAHKGPRRRTRAHRPGVRIRSRSR